MNGVVQPPRCTWEVPADLDDANLIADLKVDGDRIVLYVNHNPNGGGQTTALTRRLLVRDIPGITDRLYEGLDGTVLDGELFQGRYLVFDMPVYKGVSMRNLPLRTRREAVELVVRAMANSLVEVIPSLEPGQDIMEGFRRVVAAGGEGLVVKHLDAPYGQRWAKLKKSYDVSCIITGFKDGKGGMTGMVGAVQLSVVDDGKLVEVGWAKPRDFRLHAAITADKAAYIGKVVDVFAQELTTGGRLRHPTFHRFRDDIAPQDCTLDKLRQDFRRSALTSR